MDEYIVEYNYIIKKYKEEVLNEYFRIPLIIQQSMGDIMVKTIKEHYKLAIDKIFKEDIGFSIYQFKNKYVLDDKKSSDILKIFNSEHFKFNTNYIIFIFEHTLKASDTLEFSREKGLQILKEYLISLEKLESKFFASLMNTPNNYFKYIPKDITTIISDYTFKFSNQIIKNPESVGVPGAPIRRVRTRRSEILI